MKLMHRLGNLLPPIQEPSLNFNDGPMVENPEGNPDIKVRFLLGGDCVYDTTIGAKQWAKASIKYCADWRIEITAFKGLYKKFSCFDPSHRNVRVNLDSRSMGDTLAWLPQISAFKKRFPNAIIFVSTFWESFEFQKTYPEFRFISPDEPLDDCYAVFNLGMYFQDIPNHHPVDPRTVPLGKIASDILGVHYQERRPRLPSGTGSIPIGKPYVCIATTSTAACKQWLYKDGWQSLVDHLHDRGFRTVVIQKEATGLKSIIDRTGDVPITNRITELQGCEFFIGLGSGLSWLAWAVGKPVVLISGFSQHFAEFERQCVRVSNPDVCNGCWNDSGYVFDRKDWNWCPRLGGSDRQHECSYAITPKMVLDRIYPLISAIDD